MKYFHIFILLLGFCLHINGANSQAGPDPWHSGSDEGQIPTLKRKSLYERSNSGGIGEWSFKRLLAIIMKRSQNKKNNDGNRVIHIQLTFSPERWHIMEEYLKPDTTYTDDMFRRALGYVEEAISRPSVTETMTMAWSEYVGEYLTMYKVHITWTFGIFGAVGTMLWLWNRMSQRHVLYMIFGLLYLYEVVISYKEAEQQELQKFLSAVNTCKWYFWTDDCNVPSPDPLIFMKHMNPAKIAIRMFTNWISEPFITMSTIFRTLIHGVTDGLWFPFDVIVSGFLNIGVNILFIILLIMLIFNYIFNIPFNLGFLFFNIRVPHRNNNAIPCTLRHNETQGLNNTNGVAGHTLDKILNMCSLALETATDTRRRPAAVLPPANNIPRIRRSASTGRLPSFNAIENDIHPLANHVRQRRNFNMDGGGDS